MRRMIVVTTALVMALGAAPAAAKEIHSAQVCGKAKCVVTKEKRDIRGFFFAGAVVDEPPSGPFYTVELVVLDGGGGRESWTIDYAPGPNVIRVAAEFGGSVWHELDVDPTSSGLDELVAQLRPFPGAAFDVAMEQPPGAFTRADLPDLSAPDTKASSSRPDNVENTWLPPLIGLTVVALVILASLVATRRRAVASRSV